MSNPWDMQIMLFWSELNQQIVERHSKPITMPTRDGGGIHGWGYDNINDKDMTYIGNLCTSGELKFGETNAKDR